MAVRARISACVALAIGLQGRLGEAETLVKADLPPEEAAKNVAYLKRMLAGKENARAEADKKIPLATARRPD